MNRFTLEYHGYWNDPARANITVFEPRELPGWMWPGCQVVIVTEPYPYSGLSVTNGAERIAQRLCAGTYGVSPSSVFVEHYTQQGYSDDGARHVHKPTFDVVRFHWHKDGMPELDQPNGFWWHPVSLRYYPILLERLGEPCPPWITDLLAKGQDFELA